MQSGVIVRRNSGLIIPDVYAAKAIEENPTAWGAAISSEGKLLTNKGSGLTLELLKITMNDFAKDDITFFFANSTAAVNDDDIPPYTILSNEANELQLLAFITGEFPSFAKTGSSHPPEFFLAHEYLIPKLQDVFDLTGGDIAKVMEFIKKPLFKKELLLNVVDSGYVTLMSPTETFTIAQGNSQSEYQWGWVSNNYGYAIGPGKTEPKKEEKPKGMFSKSTTREKAPVAASSAVAEATKPPATAGIIVKNYTKAPYSPPKQLSRQEKKKWYKNRIGYLPVGWLENVAIELYMSPENKIMTMAQVKALGLSVVGLPQLNNPPRVKDTEPDNIPDTDEPQPEPVVDKPVTTERLPLMSPETREHLKAIMADAKTKKVISDNATIISDPKRVQELEAKFQNFCGQLGIKSMDDFMSWSYPMMYDLGKEKLDGLAVMCWNFRNMVAHHMTKAKAAEEPAEEKPKPVKQGMFSRKAG